MSFKLQPETAGIGSRMPEMVVAIVATFRPTASAVRLAPAPQPPDERGQRAREGENLGIVRGVRDASAISGSRGNRSGRGRGGERIARRNS